MQIASLIKGAEGHSANWAGPDVYFYDDGSVSIRGVLTAEQLHEVNDLHFRFNSNAYKARIDAAERKPAIVAVHDPRPALGSSPHSHGQAPVAPYRPEQTK